MAHERRDLHRLARELASLTPEERTRVIAEATRLERLRQPPRGFAPPVLTGGTRWVGGDLRRDSVYGDDGR
jgi:hypothetical protein